jgi:hypothetical protein
MATAANEKDTGENKRKPGRPVVYTEERTKSHYKIPVVNKEQLVRIANHFGVSITETFVKLVNEEYDRKIHNV